MTFYQPAFQLFRDPFLHQVNAKAKALKNVALSFCLSTNIRKYECSTLLKLRKTRSLNKWKKQKNGLCIEQFLSSFTKKNKNPHQKICVQNCRYISLLDLLLFYLLISGICEHDMWDSGQVWELMSWKKRKEKKSGDVVFTPVSGRHIKRVCSQLLSSYRGSLLNVFVWDSQRFNQAIVWGEFLICDYNSRSMRISALSCVSDKKKRRIYIKYSRSSACIKDNHCLLLHTKRTGKQNHRVNSPHRASPFKWGLC